MLRAIGATLAMGIAAAAILFGSAGRWDLPILWIYLALMLAASLVLVPLLARHHPGMLEERMRPGPGERDRATSLVLALGMPAIWTLTGLDLGRFHWSRGFPPGLQGVGLAGVLAGFWIAAWAMWVNPFFSSAVRLQDDRRQTLVASGPYARVRHPGYAGALLFTLGNSLALGSWWSLLPAVIVTAALVRRTQLEDRMLQRELPGYEAYARAVRFRLVPGLW